MPTHFFMANKKDIGNLNNKDFGIELNPKKDLCLVEDGEKGQKAYYKNKEMSYTDYICEVGDRISKAKNGKGLGDVGTFAGFGSGTLKKPYKE